MVTKTQGRGRAVAAGVLLAGMLILCPLDFALNPALDVNQYAHTAWRTRDGFAKGYISSIAQTPDGYLWLGTDFGLFRFDGVRAVPWQSPPDQHLPSNMITRLLAARDGTLWIATHKGLASWKDGKLAQYAELAGTSVNAIVEDHEGTIWAYGMSRTGEKANAMLYAIQYGSVQRFREDSSLGGLAYVLYVDSKGNLWAGGKDGVWRWKPGPPRFYPLPGEPNGIQPNVLQPNIVLGLAEDADGTLLISSNAVYKLVEGRTLPYTLPRTVPASRTLGMLRDRDGGLWLGTLDQGLLHVHQGRTDGFAPYAQSDGLSGETVFSFFEDREGSIWVVTDKGLDRFRDYAVGAITTRQGLSSNRVTSVLAAKDGTVWLGTNSGLNQWKDGETTASRTGRGKPDGKLNGQTPLSIFEDARGRLWISTYYEFGYLEQEHFVSLAHCHGCTAVSIVQDKSGDIWVAQSREGLFHISHGSVVKKFTLPGLGHKDPISVLAADSLEGGLWLGFRNGGVAYFKDDQVRAAFAAADGLATGRADDLRPVEDFRIEPGGTLWVASAGGLSRLKNGRISTLNSKNGLPCDVVHWSMEDNDHSVWLYTNCGLLRIARAELDAWAAAADKDVAVKVRLNPAVFDNSDGVRIIDDNYYGFCHPQVAKSPDGRLWFVPLPAKGGVSVVDPAHLPFNKLPPPVHVEQITADRKTYDAASYGNGEVPLPASVRDLEIDYTALSLVAPEKVRFRYKLEGRDRDWQDVGNRRQAFYSNLAPGNYRFRVIACNNSGVWNEAGTSLNFYVAPAYYQTWWFRSFCAAAFLVSLFAVHRLRLLQVERRFSLRLEGRVAERTRIARDLHDTLLQSFQGVLLKLHAVTYVIPDRPAEAQKTLKNVIEEARQAITEGRDAVGGLRAPGLVGEDIAQALGVLGKDLANDQNGAPRPDFHVQVEGTPRDISPLLRDEIYRIACEALRNSFRHAQAGRVEVEVRYDPRQLQLRVRDNGKGIDPKVLESGARAGHYGLPGLRERTKLIGGMLEVWSELDSGTEVELTVPASIAYAKSTTPQSTSRRTGT